MNLFNIITQYSSPLLYAGTTIAPIIQRVPNFSNEGLEKSIREQFNELINKSNIRSDLQFRIIENPSFCSAKGINFGKLGNPHILLAPKLHEVDKDAFSFIVKHELSHIKNNDLFTIPALGLATYLGLRFFINEKASKSLFVNYLTYILPMIPMIFLSRYREKKADEYAISNSSKEELEGGLYFFEASKAINLSSILDPYHPSLEQRIKQVKQGLEKKGHPIPDMEWGSEGFKRKSNLIKLMHGELT